MYNNVMNRGLFRRYAKQPQPPQAPSGIMASSPELMQTAMRYQQGGMVQPPVAQPRVNPQFRPDLMRFQEGGSVTPPAMGVPASGQVDVSQAPTQFKLTNARGQPIRGAIAEPAAEQPVGGRSAPSSPMSGGSAPVEVDELIQAEAEGEALLSGEKTVDRESLPQPLIDVAPKVVDPDATESERADAILGGLNREAPKGAKNKIEALKSTISDVFGVDASRYDNLRSLNRAAVGFAIARGDDIADALAKGVQGAAQIEEKQLAREDAMSKMALEQAFAEKVAGMRAAGAGGAAKSRFSPTEAFEDQVMAAYRSIMTSSPGIDPEEAFALARTQVQSLPAYGGQTPPPAAGGGAAERPVVSTQEEYDALPSGTEFLQNGQVRKKP